MANLVPSPSSIPAGNDKGQARLFYISPNQTPVVTTVGLVASNFYCIKPNGQLSQATAINPVTAIWSQLPADIYLNSGIYVTPPGCKGLLINTQTQAFTGSTAPALQVVALFPPPPLSQLAD